MPTIRVDDEVYRWLQSHAVPFDDSPNSVLRRIAGLNGLSASSHREEGSLKSAEQNRSAKGQGAPSTSYSAKTRGNDIISEQGLKVVQGRFRVDGKFFEKPTKYPAALCDERGFIILHSEDALIKTSQLKISHARGGDKINVDGIGISGIRGYQRYVDWQQSRQKA